MLDNALNTPLKISFSKKARKGTTINEMTGCFPISILNFNFTQYYSHCLNRKPYVFEGICLNNQHSKCSWMSEHATTLTKTLGGRLFKMYSEQKLGAPLSRVGIRISTWQMQISATSFFIRLYKVSTSLSTWGQILIVIIKLERQVKIT